MKHLCFDFDGTIVDSRLDITRAVNRIRRNAELDPVSVTEVTNAIGAGAWELIEKTLPEASLPPTETLVDTFRDIYLEICTDNVELYPHIRSILDEVTDHRLAIITNKPTSMTERMLTTSGLDNFFDPVYGADSFDMMKPDPTPLKALIDEWEISADDLIMIGDSWTDMQAGNNAGCATVGCLYGLGDSQRLKKESPDWIVESPEELHEILKFPSKQLR